MATKSKLIAPERINREFGVGDLVYYTGADMYVVMVAEKQSSVFGGVFSGTVVYGSETRPIGYTSQDFSYTSFDPYHGSIILES